MYIVVSSITDRQTLQPCHGSNLARLARECFVNYQPLTVDFTGIDSLAEEFFQAFIQPLVTEFGSEFLNQQLQLTNVNSSINAWIQWPFKNTDDYSEQPTLFTNRASDPDFYELNVAWLIKARELAKENSLLAELTMGIGEDDMRLALTQLSIEDIRHIAQSGWLCFSPRFTTHFIHSMSTQRHDVVNVLLGLSGSL